MPTVTAVYRKAGVIFPDAVSAASDRVRFFPADLQQQIINSYNELRANNVLIGATQREWDQDTFTLRIIRHVSDVYEYNAATKWRTGIAEMCEQAGWTFVETTVSE